MAKQSLNFAPINDTDANFRLWGKGISDALTAFGWIKTADTGQIDWATVTRAATTNTVQGYEIWRMNDALHGSGFPVYMKLEYGTGNATNVPGVWTQFGTGSNGSGALTGSLSARRARGTSSNSATLMSCHLSGDTNRFLCGMFYSGANANTMWFAVERTKDAAGGDTNEGILILGNSNNGGSAAYQQFLSFTTGAAAEEANLGALTPAAAGGGVSGTQTSLFPIFLTKGIFLNPPLNVLAYVSTSIAAGSGATMPYYGATRAFLPMGTPLTASGAYRTGTTGIALLMRNE